MRKYLNFIEKSILVITFFLLFGVVAFAENQPVRDDSILQKEEIVMGEGEQLNIKSFIADYEQTSVYRYKSYKINTVEFEGDSGIFSGVTCGVTNIMVAKKDSENNVTYDIMKITVKPPAEDVSLNAKKIVLSLGRKYNLNAYIRTGASYQRTFSSHNNAIATVTDNGMVQAKSEGITTATVTTFNGKTATCAIYVVKKAPQIKISEHNTKVQVGSTVHKMIYKLYNFSGLNIKVRFVSSNTKTAAVFNGCFIKALRVGTVKITLKTNYDNLYAVQVLKIVDDALVLNRNSTQLAWDYANITKVKYGYSVQGKPLEAYVIQNIKTGKYNKTLFMDFAVHGFEDAYFRDGHVLVNEANKLINYFVFHSDKLTNYRLVIVPCANPDGTIAGKNNNRASSNAFGRCTARHIDMNRDFKSFKATESRALRNCLQKMRPNVYLNMHGWLNETLGTAKLNSLINRVQSFPVQKNIYVADEGYIIGWVHNQFNIPCSLVEYKSPNKVFLSRDVNMIVTIIQSY